MSDSPEQTVPVRARTKLETHMQTLLLTLVAGLIAWQGVTTLKLIETSARQDERITQLITLTEQLRNDLRDADNQYMTIQDASLYRDQMNGRIDALTSRLSRLENR
ncbi:hypothetical protein FIU88_08195 [Halomonas sp. THAF12]|uniref:hypothetical protein n=1 Tax=Halomonas sp. THAF12 TaxID=2587849 RepID=UPI001268AC5A|nr:hypothetical protein [Halomonas sp. THAF12]QFT84954.1 hypothetical protein FIU88_08195 [Halomonas sp. THAF12]